ncbi:hypothetical protein GCM10009547_16250 [Sporichthya brevicatena]|uniref:Tetratricopeptide repeat protein n=1 Tax=Sporichthya brevicatena TaxID=171442 RepID=A0ABN1GNB5_9ACTN
MPERPHALACFPSPLSYVLVDARTDPEARRCLDLLAAGRQPESWPASLRGVQLAVEGDVASAAACFAGPSLVDRINRFVLAPDPADLPGLRTDAPPELLGLIDAFAFEVGLSDDPPALVAANGEIAALVLAAQASHAAATGSPDVAIDLLRRAAAEASAVSPATQAVMLGTAGMLAAGDPAAATDPVADLTQAVTLLADSDLAVSAAELHLQLGSVLHERAAAEERPPREAIHHYQSALQLIDEASAPYLWASAHLNLGTAYLVMPMVQASDQLRVGIATQSLRSALRVFAKEAHPEQWASAQINLANALVYMPSTHRADNLVEAVGLYEEVLEHRDGTADPSGRARLLTNIGNALAHLGVFEEAKARLVEARYLFETESDLAGVMTVRSILDEIARETVPSAVSS